MTFRAVRFFVRILLWATAGFALSPLTGTCPAQTTASSPASGAETSRLSVEQIFGAEGLSGNAPSGFAWAPDSSRAIFRNDAGDVMAVDAAGNTSLMIDHSRLSVLTSAPATERDRDHRARYGQPDLVWGPDSEHLLLNTAGDLVLYSPKTGTGLQIAATGMGSGDDPKFSPNGAYISYVRDHNLYLRRLRSRGEEVALTRPKENRHEPVADASRLVLEGEVDWVYEEELNVRSNYYWSPDSKRVAYLEMDESNVPQYPIPDWLPVHPGVERQPYPQPGDPNPAVRVGVVGDDGGKTTWIKLPFDLGNDYIPRFGWINTKTLWVETLSRDQKHLNLYFADAQNGSSILALQQTDDKFFDASYDVFFTGSDFFLLSWADGHTHIYRYGFDARNPISRQANLVRQLTSGPYEVTGIAGIDEGSETVYFTSNEGDLRGQRVWSVKADGSGKARLSGKSGFHQPAFAGDGGLYVDTASDTQTPPSVSLCHKQSCRVIWASKPLALKVMSTQALELRDADASGTLYGSLLLPSGAETMASGSVPIIVNPYGGPGVQGVKDEWGNASRLFDELLAQRGYAVLHVDNRGMSGRGRDFAQAAYRNFGPIQLADQLSAIDQVLARYPLIDRSRVGFWGWSWGGSFTLYALTHSDRFRMGIAVAPVTDWRDYDSIYTERYLGLPATNPDAYRDDSPVTTAAGLKGRVLLAHGTGDDNVHLGNSVQFIERLIEANVPYDFEVYPRKTHSIRGPESRIHLYTRMLEQFDRYLKPPRE